MSSSEPQPVPRTKTRSPNPSISAHDPAKQNMPSPFIETLQDTPPFDETPQGSCQLSIRDTWVRTWKVKRPRTPRGHTHDHGTSQRQGHLGGTPATRAHIKDMDTYACRHRAKEHTSRTRTPSEGHMACVTAGYLYQPYWTGGISPEP